MSRALLFTIRLHDGRWHGVPEWPPSPARLFQALVAGAAIGAELPESACALLRLIECLPPPVIAAPNMRQQRGFETFVPNNGLDAVGGDPDRVSEIRVGKTIRPRLFDAAVPFLYLWALDNDSIVVDPVSLSTLAERLYQFGRGVDMAFAKAELLDHDESQSRLDAHSGIIYHAGGTGGTGLPCPSLGSLDSLIARQKAQARRFSLHGQGKKAKTVFTQPPKPFFVQAIYDAPPKHLLFDLDGPYAPWPLERAADLAAQIRDAAAARLCAALPDKASQIERVFGKHRDMDEADKAQRLQIIPLPSIGTTYTDPRIRRVLVKLPQNMPLARASVEWAFSSLALGDEVGEVTLSLLVAQERAMLGHYGIEAKNPSRLWRSITPLALPQSAARRRIDPARRVEDAKGGAERAREEAHAAAAVRAALRHAGIRNEPASIRVPRDVLGRKGAGAEEFAQGTRFAKHSLWHVEIRFATPVYGPMVLGNGRYLGLGLLHPPVRPAETGGQGIVSFAITDGLVEGADPLALASALRRAMLARVKEYYGSPEMPVFFHGHTVDGTPNQPGGHEHVAVVADVVGQRLHIFAPHLLERRDVIPGELRLCGVLDAACRDITSLRAGAAGLLALSPSADAAPRLLAPSRHWTSLTPYAVTRHLDAGSAYQAVIADVELEIARLGLPRPHVKVLKLHSHTYGLSADISLGFAVALEGPILVGRTRHKGGGVFVPAEMV